LIIVPLLIALISLACAYFFKADLFDGWSKTNLYTYAVVTLSGFALILYASYYRFRGK